jgi:oligopeptidase A
MRSLLIMTTFLLHRASLARPLGVGLLTHTLFFNSSVKKARCDSSKFASTSATLLENPLNVKDGIPKFKEIKPEHVVPAVTDDLNQMKDLFRKLELYLDSSKPDVVSYSGVVEELEKIQAPLSYSWGVVGHLMGVKNSDELRKAHDSVQSSIIEAHQSVGQSSPLFKALAAIKEKDWSSLDEAQQRIIESNLRQMRFSGVDLPPETKAHFNKLKLELAELSTKFSNNLLDSTKQFQLRITNASELDGLPASTKGLLAQNAVRAGDKDATPEHGPWVLTLDMPAYLPVMQHLKNRQLRETLYRAYITRASEGEKDNAPLIQRILQIKQEVANLLGFACHADKSLASKMASSTQSVMQLIEMLRERSFPAAQRELDELRNFAKKQGADYDLQLWDVPFWSERLREAEYQFEQEALRAYLPLPAVLDGLFSLANRLFGVKIIAADGEAQVWHEDVRFFKVLDEESGEEIAAFFLDPYSRPAEKRGGAWMDVCLGRSKVLNRRPVAYLTCNGSPPVGNQPSLMTFREVETLFHEFGHGLQHMLTRVEHADAAGISNVEWDAVELPSQFMENWCYDKPTLYSFAKHYETGEPLPEELFEKLKAAKNFQAGMQMLRQLFFGAMDMHLHSQDYDPYGAESVFEVQQRLAKLYTVMPPLPEDRFLCSFGHIFAGGYSAGYYSYKWAEVMSADAFAAFEEAGLDNEQAVRETGRRFRETVLAMGGGKHPAEVYRAYRGRDPSPEALLRHSGLA